MPHLDNNESEEVAVEKEEHQDLNETPLVTFALLTDIQYANVDDGLRYDKKKMRYYRNSLNLVKEAVENWQNYCSKNNRNIKFLIQLGDLIDGKCKDINDSLPAMDKVLNELNMLYLNGQSTNNAAVDKDTGFPLILHIWGNHEMYNFLRKDLLNLPLNSAKYLNQNLDSQANFYTYDVTDRLCLICLDFYEYSILGYEKDDPMYLQALDYLKSHNKNADLNSVEGMRGHALRFSGFNGSLSDKQMKWLEKELSKCKEANKKVIVVGHLPIHAQSASAMCLAWNSKEVLEILWSFDQTVIAYFSGHDHDGGYFRDKKNIHHVTFAAIIETPPNSNAYATVKVFQNKVSIEGVGVIGYYEVYFDR